MKTRINNVKKGVVTLLFAAVIAGLTACETDPVKSQRGELPDKDLLENTYVNIRSIKSPTEFAVVTLSEGTTVTEDRISCRLTRPAERAMTITAAVDESLVEACNEEYGTDLLPFPAGNVTIAGNGTIAVAAGERISDKIQVSFKSDGLAAGTYLLPIAISSNDAALTDGGKAVYYGVKVRGIDIGNYELDTEYLNVFYLNTTEYQPLLADIWILQKTEAMPPFNTLWERTYGNIVNLRIVQIGYEADTERALLVLNSDIRYVLEHADKYIRPLQDKGRKVCLSLEGNGSGLGFCNLTDSQIADFTAQVKACLELYDLDGVNFFDRNAGYGQVEGDEHDFLSQADKGHARSHARQTADAGRLRRADRIFRGHRGDGRHRGRTVPRLCMVGIYVGERGYPVARPVGSNRPHTGRCGRFGHDAPDDEPSAPADRRGTV